MNQENKEQLLCKEEFDNWASTQNLGFSKLMTSWKAWQAAWNTRIQPAQPQPYSKEAREQTLDELTAISQRLGLYEPSQPHKGLAKEIAKIIEPYCFRELSGSELQSDDYAITTQRKQQEGAIKRAEDFLKAYNAIVGLATTPNEHELVKEIGEAERKLRTLPLPTEHISYAMDVLSKCKQALSVHRGDTPNTLGEPLISEIKELNKLMTFFSADSIWKKYSEDMPKDNLFVIYTNTHTKQRKLISWSEAHQDNDSYIAYPIEICFYAEDLIASIAPSTPDRGEG